jgi:hypothetical protein
MTSIMGDTLLAQLGQVAAIILAIYLLINILIGLVFALVFMFAVGWVGEKAELIKKLRPTVESVNSAIKNPEAATSPHGADGSSNKLVQVVHSIQGVGITQKIEGVEHGVQSVEQKVGQGADRVASTVIELRARTAQAQGVLKALFLPGLTRKSTDYYALSEGATERSLINGASMSPPQASPSELPVAPEPLSLASPDKSNDDRRVQVASTGDGSTGNASHA